MVTYQISTVHCTLYSILSATVIASVIPTKLIPNVKWVATTVVVQCIYECIPQYFDNNSPASNIRRDAKPDYYEVPCIVAVIIYLAILVRQRMFPCQEAPNKIRSLKNILTPILADIREISRACFFQFAPLWIVSLYMVRQGMYPCQEAPNNTKSQKNNLTPVFAYLMTTVRAFFFQNVLSWSVSFYLTDRLMTEYLAYHVAVSSILWVVLHGCIELLEAYSEEKLEKAASEEAVESVEEERSTEKVDEAVRGS